jgi:hypothetical protein
MDTWSEAVIQEKGSWFLEHDNIPTHSARIVKHFLSNPALWASTTHHIHLTSCQFIFCFPQRKKTPSKHLFFTHAINPWEVDKPTGYRISQYTK